MSDTKREILEAALSLFGRDGYEAVSVSAIAGKLGITKGALYKHYKSKRDIFDTIVAFMEKGDLDRARDYSMPEEEWEKGKEEYRKTSLEQVAKYSKAQFRYWTEDELPSMFRKMLTLEQYRDKEMERLYQQYLVLGPFEYVRDIFAELRVPNPEAAAGSFYGIMFLMYSVYDGAENNEAVISMLDRCIDEEIKRVKEEIKK